MEPPTVVELSGFRKAYGGRVLFDDLSLSIREGESVVLLGPSGSGKSVLLHHLLGLQAPDRGRILVHGMDTAGLRSSKSRRAFFRDLGVVFQSSALFDDLTLAENVGLGVDHARSKEAAPGESPTDRAAAILGHLARVRLEAAADRRPAEVSGGMQRRAALARAVASAPRLLFLDEPTAGLDPESESVIVEYLRELRRRGGLTLLTITHSCSCAAALADTVYAVSSARRTLVRLEDPAGPASSERLMSWSAGILKEEAAPTAPTAPAAPAAPPVGGGAWLEPLLEPLDLLGSLGVLLARGLRLPPLDAFLQRLWEVGAGSVPLIFAAFAVLGMALAVQADRFPLTQGLVAEAVAQPVFRSLGALVTALLLAGRVTAGVSAEIGALRASGQLVAYWTLGRDPDARLLPPLLAASVLATPLLTLLAMAAALAGGAALVELGLLRSGMTTRLYCTKVQEVWRQVSLVGPMLKAAASGALVCLVGYHFGRAEKTSTRELGEDVTRAVVAASFLVILADFMLNWLVR